MASLNNIVRDCEKEMSALLDRLKTGLQKFRTGRANSSLVEDVKISYYGALTSLYEMATIIVPEPNLIQIKPFDRNSIADIENAIRNADLGFNPINDGNFIRVVLPPLTEERRADLLKQVKKVGEETKVTFRTSRGDSWEIIQEMVKSKELTEDDKYRMEKELNDLISKMNFEVDRIVKTKEEELMKI